jgi:hypothetical protein
LAVAEEVICVKNESGVGDAACAKAGTADRQTNVRAIKDRRKAFFTGKSPNEAETGLAMFMKFLRPPFAHGRQAGRGERERAF